MWIVVAVLIVTALWIVLGAVLHGGRDAAETAGEPWWWEASGRSTGTVSPHLLPPSHPLARAARSVSRSG